MKNHMKIFWYMTFHTKIWLVQNHCLLGSKNVDGFIRVYYGTKYLALFGSEKVMPFTIGLHIL